MAIGGFVAIAILMLKRVPGAVLIGIILITATSFVAGLTPLPSQWASAPPSLVPIFLGLDIAGSLTWGMFSVILTVFVLAFLDTLGTLIALGYNAELLDKDGNLPEMEKPMMVDAVATTVASLLGTTTSGAYIESATGIAAGARSGLASVVTAFLFLLALFLAPTFTAVPAHAYGPALIIVGILMLTPITKIQFGDLTESIPAFCVVALMSFTFNIGIGMTAGFVAYPFLKVVAGRWSELKPGMWVLGLLSLLFYVFYPY
jgi:AGZA family xanthine/uracil permease-like MFS transporter